MDYFVYILYSKRFDKFYIGQTKDLDNRLARHNNGLEKASSPYRPYTLVWMTQKSSRSQVVILEQKLKNLSKDRIKKIIEKYR